MNVHITVLLVFTPSWKLPKYLSMNVWLNKLWYTHSMKCYSSVQIILFMEHSWNNYRDEEQISSSQGRVGVGCGGWGIKGVTEEVLWRWYNWLWWWLPKTIHMTDCTELCSWAYMLYVCTCMHTPHTHTHTHAWV